MDKDNTVENPTLPTNNTVKNIVIETNNIDTDNAWLADSYSDTFKIGFVNAASLKRHFKQFKELFEDDPSYHVIGAESRFGDAVDDNIFSNQRLQFG